MTNVPEVSVSEQTIQDYFNDGGYWDKAKTGVFQSQIKRNQHRVPEKATTLPHCTHSQIVKYIDQDDTVVAVVHQYILPDGSIGGSGKPDPKMLFHNGTRYRKEVT